MLIENKKKGWYGSFSDIGRRAARSNFLISRKALSSETKKKYINKNSLIISAFEASENKNIYNKIGEDTLDIFNIDETDKIKLDEITKTPVSKAIALKKTIINKEKINQMNQMNKKFYYYHIQRQKKIKLPIQGNPPCTKYNPKYTSIFRRDATSPPWSTMKGRGNIFGIKVEQHPFYIQHKNILDTMAGKTFIDMKKQKQNETKNKSAIISPKMKLKAKKIKTNIEERKRPYSSINARLRRKNYSINLRNNLSLASSEHNKILFRNKSYNSFNISGIKKTKKTFTTNINKNTTIEVDYNKSTTRLNNSSSYISKIKEDSKDPLDISVDSYESFKNIYKNEIKKKKDKNLDKTFTKEIIKGPNFEQMISRETLDRLRDDKIPIVPYLLPNFSSVRGQPIMMVVYDRKYHKINRNKSDSLIKVDNTFYYDPNEILTKINNYTSIHPPNFNMMASRPDDDDPLPSYMKKIFTRNSCYEITQLSLKLNNYKNRGFANIQSSFAPKKSFNKIINLNLLKSKKFLNDVIGNKNVFYRQFKGLGTSLRYYNKNYEDIMRDNFLERFDNVTYKTIKKEHSKNIIELINKIKEDYGE